MRYLGIDYGTKRVGLALSDEGGVLAFPFSVINNDGRCVSKIEQIVFDKSVEEIVLGESFNSAGEHNPIMKEALSFRARLALKIGMRVRLEPEQFTSCEAFRAACDFGGEYSRVPRGDLNASAAALILQRYIDKKSGRARKDKKFY